MNPDADILFWSGGKDAWLALQLDEHARQPVLLTTYDETTHVVPHQQIPLDHIRLQAQFLQMELITVPLPPDCPNQTYLDGITEALRRHGLDGNELIFGDLHLQDLREWRENMFHERGYTCRFPLWNRSYNRLFDKLWQAPASIMISSVMEEHQAWIRVGEPFTPELVEQLPVHIDPMGEKGEFHTRLDFKQTLL